MINTGPNGRKCPLCGGSFSKGETSYMSDYGTGIIIIRKIPALICSQCGEECFENETANKLEELVTTAKKANKELEILTLA